mmetsp:Transcript_5498/g.17623  ORF Transcript_5498/g.17623 Transcript_5498/m.17623 type:complete len:81 (+) Transcript_5498:330-572(+)
MAFVGAGRHSCLRRAALSTGAESAEDLSSEPKCANCATRLDCRAGTMAKPCGTEQSLFQARTNHPQQYVTYGGARRSLFF